MTSIAEIHKASVLEYTVKSLYSTGIRPDTSTVLHYISRYFSDYPAGSPLPTELGTNKSGLRSDPESINAAMAHAIMNLSMLYRVNNLHSSEVMEINTLLRIYLEKLAVKRKKLVDKVDDYLLSLYNTDGYYYSVSDSFSDVSRSALEYSTAFIDVASSKVTLPIRSSLSVNTIYKNAISHKVDAFVTRLLDAPVPLEDVDTAELIAVNHNEVGDLKSAFDGLSNTVWGIEIERDKKSEVVVDLRLLLHHTGRPVEISRIEYNPYGITPVQVYIESTLEETPTIQFGQKVVTTDSKVAFINNTIKASSLVFKLRKTEPDYTVVKDNKTYYKYIFGAKDIVITQSVYDNEAVFVSKPLSIADLSGAIIDAVSLHAEDNIPAGTAIKYYVARNDPVIVEETELDWKEINPVTTLSGENTIVKFNSTTTTTNFIRNSPKGTELQLTKPLLLDNTLLSRGSVYKITDIDENYIPETINLEEGFNTTKILYKAWSKDNYTSLDNWKNEVKNLTNTSKAYGRIDTGQGFFSGITVGEPYLSYYVETYLESSAEHQTVIRECLKNPYAQPWDLKIFLNGEEISNMPVGIQSVPVSWKFNKGLNHVAVLIDVPAGTASTPHPEIGLFDLMLDDSLFNYGVVRLNKWDYVDEFALNEDESTTVSPGRNPTFSIVEGHIVSRIKPTDNFRIRYSRSNNRAPDSIRVKAILTRDSEDTNVTPSIDLYRLRFLYGDEDGSVL